MKNKRNLYLIFLSGLFLAACSSSNSLDKSSNDPKVISYKDIYKGNGVPTFDFSGQNIKDENGKLDFNKLEDNKVQVGDITIADGTVSKKGKVKFYGMKNSSIIGSYINGVDNNVIYNGYATKVIPSTKGEVTYIGKAFDDKVTANFKMIVDFERKALIGAEIRGIDDIITFSRINRTNITKQIVANINDKDGKISFNGDAIGGAIGGDKTHYKYEGSFYGKNAEEVAGKLTADTLNGKPVTGNKKVIGFAGKK